MGTKIGAGWHKFSENGAEYIQISINKELNPLIITDEQTITLFAIPKDKKKSENSPTYDVVLDKRIKKAD